MRAPRLSGETFGLAVLLLIVGMLCGLPLALLARLGLGAGGLFSFEPLVDALNDDAVWRALANSLVSSAVSALIATLAGTALALVLGLTDLRAKGALMFLVLVPMMIPPHVTAIAWIQALGPNSAVLKALGLAPPIGTTHPLYSAQGVIGLLAVQHAPLVLLIVRAALRGLPREMSEAARIAGATPWRMLRRIILPLLAPSLIAGYALAFVSALGNFGIPALLGIPARYTTLPVLIWQRLASFGPSVLTEVAILSALVALLAVAAVSLQLVLQRRARVGLIGQPQEPLHIRLGAARPLVEAGLWLLIALVLLLPVAALLGTALVPTYGVPLNLATLTFANFHEILFTQSVTARAFVNSTLIAGIASLLLALLALGLGYYLNRASGVPRNLAGAAATLTDIAYAIPGLVISIAFILALIRPLPLLNVSLYNTLGIILLAYLAAFGAIALKPVSAAYGQLDGAMDDAARVAGARFFLRLRRIFFPLVAPAAASGAILVFLTAYNEVTVSALLWSTGNETIGTVIFNYEDGGYTTLAAAMAAVTVAVTIGLMLALHRFGKRLPSGVVPWRD